MSRTTAQGGSNGTRGGGNPVGAAVGVQGFVNATNFLRTAVGQIAAGNAAGFYVSVGLHVLSAPAGTTYPATCNDAAAGWISRLSAAATCFSVANGVGVFVLSPLTAVGAAQIGKILLLSLVYDTAAGKVRLYRAGVEVGAGSAIVGHTPATAATRVSVGSTNDGSVTCPAARIVGALYGTGIPTAADILAHYNACKAANTMESMTGAGVTNVNRWQAKDNIPNAATWVDDIGGMVLTKTGALSSVIFNPTWE